MNPFSGLTWLWKALRLNSVTFAVLFSLGVLGLSVTRLIKDVLGAAGVPFFGLLLIPIFLFGYFSRKEREWIAEESERKKWARRLVFGSLVIAGLLALVRPKAGPPANSNQNPPSGQREYRHRGPPGK